MIQEWKKYEELREALGPESLKSFDEKVVEEMKGILDDDGVPEDEIGMAMLLIAIGAFKEGLDSSNGGLFLNMTRVIEARGCTVRFEDSPEMAHKVFNKLIDWFVEHQCFSGESLQQMDATNIDAPIVLSDIADDVIEFEADWGD